MVQSTAPSLASFFYCLSFFPRLIPKVGGPAYRIGLGGGAASSRVGDSKTAELDFNAVQRGDAEMENRLNRLMRACVELGEDNPIVSIHDQVKCFFKVCMRANGRSGGVKNRPRTFLFLL